MSLKQEILNELGDKEMTLKELMLVFLDNKPASIRGELNMMVKKGELVRPKKATYKVFK